MKGCSYRKDYMLTHDIDWFFCHNGLAFHAASNGGIVPKEILSGENSKIQEAVYGMQEPKGVEIEINEDYIRKNILNIPQDFSIDIKNQFTDYIASFSAMAKKGFISLDRKDGNEYFWVARPKDFGEGKAELFGKIPKFEKMAVEVNV